jgi:DNA modification methylase
MQTLETGQITISPDRQRKVFNPDSLGKLAESIVSKGLMHPIILRDGEDVLVAGERRLRAIELTYTMGQTFKHNGQDIPKGHVPYTRLHDLPEDLIYEAELEENIRRENLSPQEEMQAIANLHLLRSKQNPEQTLEATANEIWNESENASGHTVDVRDALLVAEHINDPAVAKAKTKKEAAKAVHKKLQRDHAAKLASQFDKLSEIETPHVHVQGDAIETLHKMPSGIVDVLCTDPPYGIGAHQFGDMADNEHKYDDSYDTWVPLMQNLAEQSFRVCKSKAHAYVFCDISRFFELSLHFATAGWDVWSRPLIWSKANGMLAHPKHGPRYTYEVILYANKGQKEVQTVGAPDVINVSLAQNVRHAAEKPVALISNLLSRSALPGDHVLDPFMGSGTIFPAANRLKLRATGIEKDETSYGFAIQRLEEKEDESKI